MSRTKKWLWTIVTALALLAICSVPFYYFGPGLQQTWSSVRAASGVFPQPQPQPTPAPEVEPQEWVPGQNPVVDSVFTDANFSTGRDLVVACGKNPHASVVVNSDLWSIVVRCEDYLPWIMKDTTTVTDTVEVEVTQEVTETTTVTGTVDVEVTANVTETTTGTAELLVTEWFTANIPAEVVTIKVNETGGWEEMVPQSASHLLDESGVLGADNGQCNNNPSCIDTSGADHNQAQGLVVYDTIPEGSYWTGWADSFTIVAADGTTLVIPSCGSNCSIGIVLRGWHLETNEDRHLPIEVSEYGAPGAMKYTRYPVPAGAGQFFSAGYFTDQGLNAFVSDNCGAGLQDDEQDCDRILGYAFDYNDKSMVVMELINGQWVELYTNITGHGR